MTTRGTVGAYSAVTFAWFSTRLFGSLRSVLALIFDGTDRGIVAGKLFDFGATIVATLAVAVYVVFSAYLTLATTRGAELLVRAGLAEGAMGGVTYVLGRLLAVAVIIGLFFALYRGLPRRRPPLANRVGCGDSRGRVVRVCAVRVCIAGEACRPELAVHRHDRGNRERRVLGVLLSAPVPDWW